MSFFKKLFGSREAEGPFMEHPTGDFATAIDAMADAVKRLHKLKTWDRWITFTAQGQAGNSDKYESAELRMMGDQLDAGEQPVDIQQILQIAKLDSSKLVSSGNNYSIAGASPQEVAVILDAIFRHHFGIKPFADEENDYAIGAEW